MKKNMKKTLKKTEVDVAEYSAAVAREDMEKKVGDMGDDDLFYEDTVGNTNSRKNKKAKIVVEINPSTLVEKPKPFVPKPAPPKPFRVDLKLKQRMRNKRKKLAKLAKQVIIAESEDEEEDVEEDAQDEDMDMIEVDDEDIMEDEDGIIFMDEDEDDFEFYDEDDDDEIQVLTAERRKITPGAILKSLYTGKHVDSTYVAEGDNYDPWDEEDDQKIGEVKLRHKHMAPIFEENAEFLVDAVAKNHKVARNKHNDALVIKKPLVVVPSGLSVNPHPDALKAVVEVASRRAMQEALIQEKIERSLNGDIKIPKTADLTEMELEKIRKDYRPVQVRPVKVKYRTNAKKNAIKKKKQEGYESHLRAVEQAQNKQFKNIDEYIKKMEGRVKYLEKRNAEKAEEKAKYGPQTVKRMGNMKFTPAFPEVYTEDQLNGGDLRTAVQSTSIIGDVFHNLQAKNMIAVTKKKAPKGAWYKEKIRRDMNWRDMDVDEVVKRVETAAKKQVKEFAPTKNKKLKRKRGEEEADDLDMW